MKYYKAYYFHKLLSICNYLDLITCHFDTYYILLYYNIIISVKFNLLIGINIVYIA